MQTETQKDHRLQSHRNIGCGKSSLSVLVSDLPDWPTYQQLAHITCAHYLKKVRRIHNQARIIIQLSNFNKTQQTQSLCHKQLGQQKWSIVSYSRVYVSISCTKMHPVSSCRWPASYSQFKAFLLHSATGSKWPTHEPAKGGRVIFSNLVIILSVVMVMQRFHLLAP